MAGVEEDVLGHASRRTLAGQAFALLRRVRAKGGEADADRVEVDMRC